MCRKNTKSLQRFYILHFTCNVFLNTNRTNLTNYYSCYSCSYNYDYSLNTNRTYLTNYYSCHSCYSCSYNYDYSLNTNRTYLTNYYSCHSCYSCSKVIIIGCLILLNIRHQSRDSLSYGVLDALQRYSATVLQLGLWVSISRCAINKISNSQILDR